MQTDLAETARQTPPGMAGILATGPQGRTCRECSFWGGNRVEISENLLEHRQRCGEADWVRQGSMILVKEHGRRRWVRGEPVKQACMKYRALRRSQIDPDPRSRRVEHATPACLHFDAYAEPQPLERPPIP